MIVKTVHYTLTVENDDPVTIVCNLAAFLPQWTGPPFTSTGTPLTYNNAYTFNPNLEKVSRLSWAANHRDLTLNPVTRDDAGTYQCYYCPGAQTWTVNFLVRGTFIVHGV